MGGAASRWLAAVTATALVAVLTACGGEPGEPGDPGVVEPTPTTSATPSPSVTPSPTPDTPDAEPEAGPLVLPACDAVDFALLEDGRADLVAEEISATDVGQHHMGPVALAAVEDALQARGCFVYLPDSEYGVNLVLAELDASTRTNFIAALDASDYVHTELRPGIEHYELITQSPGDGMSWYSYVFYLFAEGAWIAEVGGGMGDAPGGLAPSQLMLGYLDALEAAN